MAQPCADRTFTDRAVWSLLGMFSLSHIPSAGALGTCACIRMGWRGNVLGFSAEEPLTFNPHVVFRSGFARAIPPSLRRENFVRVSAEGIRSERGRVRYPQQSCIRGRYGACRVH